MHCDILTDTDILNWVFLIRHFTTLDFQPDARSILPPHCNGQQNDQQSGYILHCCFVDCRPGGRRGDTEGVVAQWRRPVASGEALVMLNGAMRSVLLQCIRVAIEMARGGGTFVFHHHLFRLL